MGRRRKARIHGVIGIDKAAGPTSREVVDRVGRLLDERRCGHAGTLDPAATGLLVVAFGEATKTVRWLMEGRKRYLAEIAFGARTLTDDAEGQILGTAPVPPDLGPRLRELIAAVEPGPIAQIPPAVSALKTDGVRDHERVRRGEPVRRGAREVSLYGARLLSIDGPRATVEVECGKGFYVRAWARDLGEQLGSGAHLAALRRLRSSGQDVGEAVTLQALEAMTPAERLARLRPVGEALSRALPAIEVDEPTALQLTQGKRPAAPAAAQGELLVRRRDTGLLVCVATVTEDAGEERKLKVVRGFDPAVALR